MFSKFKISGYWSGQLFAQKAINWADHTSRVLFLIAAEAGKSKNKTDLVSDEKMFPGLLGERFLGCRHNSGVKYLMYMPRT